MSGSEGATFLAVTLSTVITGLVPVISLREAVPS
jgi:hypothetical protein